MVQLTSYFGLSLVRRAPGASWRYPGAGGGCLSIHPDLFPLLGFVGRTFYFPGICDFRIVKSRTAASSRSHLVMGIGRKTVTPFQHGSGQEIQPFFRGKSSASDFRCQCFCPRGSCVIHGLGAVLGQHVEQLFPCIQFSEANFVPAVKAFCFNPSGPFPGQRSDRSAVRCFSPASYQLPGIITFFSFGRIGSSLQR